MARKQKMKVYHGIPKSVTDEHTVFYASFDGILTPETGNTYECNYQSPKFVDSIIGYGLQNDVYTFNTKYSSPLQFENYDEVTIEFFYDATKVTTFSGNEHYGLYLKNKDIGIIRVLSFLNNNKTLSLRFYNSSGGTLDTITIKTEGLLNHIRLTYNRGIVNVYINGVKKLQYTKLVIDKIDNIFMYQLQAIVSDLHISNIDRGDYFPNLPQDFIDGKAIVKPRMGQQQIKGDPMYSQVTELKVPNLSNTKTSETYRDGNYRCYINYPELKTTGSNAWALSSTISIKGLNGEVISGVIDTDTALAKVTKVISPSKYVLNTIQGLSAEDTIRFYISTSSSPECTIKEVDVTTNTITLNTALSGWEVLPHYYVIETTASSSSPIVKTQDGTTVVGTWSGLGTNEATFTLGENADISGKDLYVTYALTMPLGNSDFPELPHTIERAWGENGVEMKPVNHIVITDDFKGKISGSTEECPHISKWHNFATSLLSPSQAFSGEVGVAGTLYGQLENLDNSNCTINASIGKEGKIPQQLFSFNLIEMVERKLGCEIPSRDKIQWLKDNLSLITVNLYGYASNPNGNVSRFRAFLYNSNTWSSGNVVTSSSITKSVINISSAIPEVISPEGMLHCLYHSDVASNETKVSYICTDYVEILIQLKVDSTFTTLYCENTRAREDKCNPVLIQKETKTVKRYLPSKGCFTTECNYSEFKNKGAVADLDVLINKHVNIGVGTSKYSRHVQGANVNLNQMPLSRRNELCEAIPDYRIVESIPSTITENITEILNVEWWSDNGSNIFTLPRTLGNLKTCISNTSAFKGQVGGYKDSNNNILIYGDINTSKLLNKDGVRLYDIALVNKNGELMLYIIKASRGHRFYIYSDAITLMSIPNRPLIK